MAASITMDGTNGILVVSATHGSVASTSANITSSSNNTTINTSPGPLAFLTGLLSITSPATTMSSGNKHHCPMISSDVAASDPLLLSPSCLPSSSASSCATQEAAAASHGGSHASKHSHKNKEPMGQVVAINAVNNTIWTLNDTFTMKFQDKLTNVSRVTTVLYQVPSLMQDQIIDLAECFASDERKATVFLSF